MKKFAYITAKQEIVKLLKDGAITNGNMLISQRKLVSILGFSRSTVRRALESLLEDGILVRKNNHNSRLYFKKTQPFILEVGDNSTNSITQDIKFNGMLLKDKTISFKLVYDIEIPKFTEYNRFYELIRIRSTKEEYFSLQKAYIPFELFQDAHRYDFSVMSLYSYMEQKGKKPIVFKKRISFVQANDEISKYLKIDKNEKLYLFEYYGYSKGNVLVEYTQSFFKHDAITINFISEYKTD